ncbi:MAG: hypothetical protein ACRC5C_01790 [Bacilli bacterium]
MKKRLFHQEDDTVFSIRKNVDEKVWEEISELASQTFKDFTKLQDGKSGIEAKNWDDKIRKCPQCTDDLVYNEISDEGYIRVQCVSCNGQFFVDDIAPYDAKTLEKHKEAGRAHQHYPDLIYRSIPKSLILECMELRKSQKEN